MNRIKILSVQVIVLALTNIILSCKGNRSENTHLGKRIYVEEMNKVNISLLKQTSFRKEIVSNGKLRSLRKSDLRFKISGELRQLKVKNGNFVRIGQTIAVLNQFELQQRLALAKTAVKRTQIEFEDALLGHGNSIWKDSVPKVIYEGAAVRSGYSDAVSELKTAEFNLEQAKLTAPFSGMIANLKHHQYEMVNNGEVFCTLIDDSKFGVEFHLIESEFEQVSVGDKIKIHTFSGGAISSGAISEINPFVDENGLVLVKATVRNEGGLWEGMNVKVIIERELPNHFVVPKSSIVLRQNQEVLFKYVKGRAFWTYVQVLLENTSHFSVIAHPDKGGELKEGDTIIISNTFNLAHDSYVKIKEDTALLVTD